MVIIFGDPEQRVQVAQPTLAFLDVRFHQITRIARLAVALVTLGELGGDEFRAGAGDDFRLETLFEIIGQGFLAANRPHFQNGGANGHVGFGQADAFIHRAGGVADLKAEVPEEIEHKLHGLVHVRRVLGRQQEQEIDVRSRRQRAATVTADCRDRDLRRILGIDILAGEIIEDFDQSVLKPGDAPGAINAAAIGLQQFSSLFPAFRAGLAENRQQVGPDIGGAFAVFLKDDVAFALQRRYIENVGKIQVLDGHLCRYPCPVG
ncbi:hypothetical protein D3C87_424830 [compost metagenome]